MFTSRMPLECCGDFEDWGDWGTQHKGTVTATSCSSRAPVLLPVPSGWPKVTDTSAIQNQGIGLWGRTQWGVEHLWNSCLGPRHGAKWVMNACIRAGCYPQLWDSVKCLAKFRWFSCLSEPELMHIICFSN